MVPINIRPGEQPKVGVPQPKMKEIHYEWKRSIDIHFIPCRFERRRNRNRANGRRPRAEITRAVQKQYKILGIGRKWLENEEE